MSDKSIKNDDMVSSLRPVYVIRAVEKGYIIKRHDGRVVNDLPPRSREECEKHLDYLVSMNYCRREDSGT